MKYTKRIMYGILMAVCVIGLSGCMNGKYRYEETMNDEILDILNRIEKAMQSDTSMEYWIKGQMGDCYMRMGELDKAGS